MSIGGIARAALGAVAVGKRIAADAATDTYQILRVTSTDDGAGGRTETEAVIESGRCILTDGTRLPQERAIGERLGATALYTVRALPATSAITASDRIRIGGAGGRVFEVLGVLKAAALTVTITAVCQEQV